MEIHLPSTLSLFTMDLERIAEVLQHLMENAAKYSPDDSTITVNAEVAGDRLITGVADRGVGVDDLERLMIFDKFYRGSSCFRDIYDWSIKCGVRIPLMFNWKILSCQRRPVLRASDLRVRPNRILISDPERILSLAGVSSHRAHC